LSYSLVSLQRENGIARLTIERPQKLNALTVPLRNELLDALATVAADDQTRCVILSGRGRAFCTGQDLDERAPILDGQDMDLGKALEEGLNRVILALVNLPQPVIAAVQGAAVGAGASLALACDIVIAAEDASFHFSFAKIGLSGDSGATWLLPKKIGPARASRVLLFGEAITARIGEEWGVVGKVVPADQLLEVTMRDAEKIASLSAVSTQSIKKLLIAASTNSLADQLALESLKQAEAGRSAAYKDSLAAFLRRG